MGLLHVSLGEGSDRYIEVRKKTVKETTTPSAVTGTGRENLSIFAVILLSFINRHFRMCSARRFSTQ